MTDKLMEIVAGSKNKKKDRIAKALDIVNKAYEGV